MGFFDKLKQGLSKTRGGVFGSIGAVFSGAGKIDDDFYDELEEILIMSDMGMEVTERILDDLKEKVKEQHIKDPAECRGLLADTLKEIMQVGADAYGYEDQKCVMLFVGVNGVGKTTTVGKLAALYQSWGKKVVIAGADTFRAAAGDQLKIWAERSGVDLVSGAEGSDPGSVVYDAVSAAKARNADLLLVDTAGRLQNKKNLMNELEKINRIVSREWSEAHRENLIVLDATTGQNALSQIREFSGVCDLTGIVLTKMDGTAKGGIAVAIASGASGTEVPVKFIGVGEQIGDLNRFDPGEFVDALLLTEKGDEQDDAGEI